MTVLASGDPFHYGVGDLLMRSFGADEMLCLPQASAFSLAAARLGWPLQDVALVSLHGRALEGIENLPLQALLHDAGGEMLESASLWVPYP